MSSQASEAGAPIHGIPTQIVDHAFSVNSMFGSKTNTNVTSLLRYQIAMGRINSDGRDNENEIVAEVGPI